MPSLRPLSPRGTAPMPQKASVLISQLLVTISIVACFALLALAPACSENQNNDENPDVNRCDYQGVCVISYTDPANNGTSVSSRECVLRNESDKECGQCWDQRFDAQKRLLSKTCLVCKLCNTDFECVQGSECATTAPFCLEGKCVTCRTNTDCEGERRFCSDKGQCVTCRRDSDCETDTAPQCEDGLCVACFCSRSDAKKPYCRKKDADLSVECVGCLKDEHCKAPTPRCDPSTYTCIAACSKDVDCAPGQSCKDGNCQECSSHDDCKDPKLPRCVTGKCQCSDDKDCPTAFPRCVQNACIQCSSSEDCPAGFPRCNSGECLLRLCASDAECTEAKYTKCRTFGPNKVCVGCIQDTECTAGQTCNLSTFQCK